MEKDTIKVLIIDDNVSLIQMVKEYFKDSSKIKVVLESYDGKDGIEVIDSKKDEYDVIVLDLIMPKKDGMYVLKEMRSRGIDKKVIVATSYNAGEVIREVAEYGVNYLILKPFDLEDLEKRIIEVCSKRRKVKQLILKLIICKFQLQRCFMSLVFHLI